MEKTLILLAGYPGTGKSYLCSKILERDTNFVLISPDYIKENLWDHYGFVNLEEKSKLIIKSWDIYYQYLDSNMFKGDNIISDYPFSDKQKKYLKSYSEKYNYQVITIRLVAQIDVLFERQKLRDMDRNRHMGHILNCYHKGQVINNRNNAEGLLTYEEFYDRCMNRGYGKFELGKTFELDVTDFNTVNYDDLLEKVLY